MPGTGKRRLSAEKNGSPKKRVESMNQLNNENGISTNKKTENEILLLSTSDIASGTRKDLENRIKMVIYNMGEHFTVEDILNHLVQEKMEHEVSEKEVKSILKLYAKNGFLQREGSTFKFTECLDYENYRIIGTIISTGESSLHTIQEVMQCAFVIAFEDGGSIDEIINIITKNGCLIPEIILKEVLKEMGAAGHLYAKEKIYSIKCCDFINFSYEIEDINTSSESIETWNSNYCDQKKEIVSPCTDTKGLHESCKQLFTSEFKNACMYLKEVFRKEGNFRQGDAYIAYKLILKAWIHLHRELSNIHLIEVFIEYLAEYSKELLKKVINHKMDEGNTSMHLALTSNNYSLVEHLLETNVCNLNQQNEEGYSCSMIAAYTLPASNDIFNTLKKVIKNSDITIKTKKDESLLIFAVSNNNIMMVKYLVKQMESLDEVDCERRSPLMLACRLGHCEIVKILLKNKANRNLISRDGKNAFDIAAACGYMKIVAAFFTCN